jgi:hypothetical protein
MRLSAVSFLAVLAAAPALAQAATPSPDATLWGSASKGAAGELQLYLAQFPAGQYAGEAKAALAALNASPAAGGASANVAAPAAATSAATTPANLKPGWLVEVRAIHQQPDQQTGQVTVTSPWVPDPVPLSITPLQGPDFDVAKLAAANPGAGSLPAIAGSAKLLVQQAGQWGIGTDIKWTKLGPCTVTVTVQGNQVINSTTAQANYAPGDGNSSYSAAVSLTPGTYDVAWTMVCQPNSTLPGQDAALSILVAPPGGALAAPTPGEFVYQPTK